VGLGSGYRYRMDCLDQWVEMRMVPFIGPLQGIQEKVEFYFGQKELGEDGALIGPPQDIQAKVEFSFDQKEVGENRALHAVTGGRITGRHRRVEVLG